ncbi:hypothetical protein [Aliiglaciecola sp. M165]|uniref:hypothetical protein n=1 Tax=Aliiglaciecola sp. M165 TaxID=2593649 RepID=UPI0011812E0F|nr:hypothetical protein [Aliiglaciecola sp. M165]TRY29780.1 hypothetical protein FM019_16550 [Aliiglaciecola sp. M165]
MELNDSLSDSQARFALWLECKMPELLRFFDFDKKEILHYSLSRYLLCAPRTEKILVRFVALVWIHENEYDFCLVEAARCLDARQLGIILEWLRDPIWP